MTYLEATGGGAWQVKDDGGWADLEVGAKLTGDSVVRLYAQRSLDAGFPFVKVQEEQGERLVLC